MIEKINKLRPLFSRSDKLQYAGLLVMMGIGAVLEMVGIGAVPAFLSTLTAPEEVRAYPGVEPVLETLGITTAQELVVWGAVGFIVIFTIRAAYLVLLKYVRIRLTERHRVRLGRLLFTKYMAAPYEFHLGRNTAELLRNVNGETKNIITGVINPMLKLVLNGLMTVCIAGLLLATTPWVALAAIVGVGGGGYLFLWTVQEKMNRYGKKARTERKKAIQAVNQGVGAFRDARVLGVEESLVDDFYRSIARYAELERYKKFVSGLGNPLLEYIAVAGLMLLVLMMVAMGTGLSAMVPLLGLFGAAIVRLRATVGAITNTLNTLQYNMASVDAVVGDLQQLEDLHHEAVALPRDTRQNGTGPPVEAGLSFDRELRFENVTYRYPNAEETALEEASLTIERGQSVGLVGATGAGKSTLVNVLLGLLEPQEGRLSADGTDVHSDLRAWQSYLGYIPQSIFLLDDTIRRNVAFGVPDDAIDDERVWEALYAAQVGDFIMNELPEGIATTVGEDGVRLSGGQRQRVGLARAIYHNPDVLVMDEATSDLDNETERRVMEALNDLKADRTFIMIAHRLRTVQNCDRLFFMKQGRIAARGTYEELCATREDFRQMAQVA
ncbi:ABC transporter ATP-binding protein [Salinibacter ruber]|uniref:ABC transporter ATP-binding protein n=1 Tax=Salinibacter ruber TaxID=146919 RepID=UPI000E59434F|nr:ABC transporter ATP-binding protein [Salinibacter ruber]